MNILITGCSSGIGRATALRLANTGHTVYATARRTEAIEVLIESGCKVLPLDVNDEASMSSAVAQIGPIDVLINNAGYGEMGAIEEVPLERIRAQFETNVFGASRLIQLVLPGMRESGHGRIINVSSMGGRLTFPVAGYYHASKYAIEAISDALRIEVKPFGIEVVLIEPGAIKTAFADTATQSLEAVGPYAGLTNAMTTITDQTYASPRTSASPEEVAAVIDKAVTARRPKDRYLITFMAKFLVHSRRLFGARAFDALLRAQIKSATT